MILSRSTWSRVFLFKGLYNIVLSFALLIWPKPLLPFMVATAGNPAFVQMFLLLCCAFGVGYVVVALNVDANAGIVLMGILGQLSVFGVVLGHWTAGAVHAPALVSGLIDLAFAFAFVAFLWTHDYPLRRLA